MVISAGNVAVSSVEAFPCCFFACERGLPAFIFVGDAAGFEFVTSGSHLKIERLNLLW
jgi:hypothetical protein